MAILPLVVAPDPRLKQASSPVHVINDDIRTFAADMLETMYFERGVGLAAVQVGVHKRILVADVEWDDKAGTPGKPYTLINPEIVAASAEPKTYKEGCLSFPEQYADVERPKTVRVKFQDLSGAWQEEEFSGLLATCVQHEIDHLNGVVFVDHLTPVKRDMIMRKLKKRKKFGVDDHHHHHDHHHVHGPDCNH